jgi:hypothetical protein
LELHFSRREGDAIEFEVAGFLHLAAGHRHVGDDGLIDVGLPDAHDRPAVLRHAFGVEQACGDGERANRRGQVAAVAAPVHKRLVDRHLAEEVIDVVVRAGAFRDDDGFAGARGGAAHAVDLFAVGVGAADHAQQECIAGLAGDARSFGQVVEAEEDAFAGTATHVGGRDFDLWGV